MNAPPDFLDRFLSWDTTVEALGCDQALDMTALGLRESLGSVSAALALAQSLAVNDAQSLSDRVTIFRRDVHTLVTVRAREKVLGLYPGKAFLEFFAAVRALEIDGYEFDVGALHGWPLLKVVFADPIVVEDAVVEKAAA